MTTMFRLERDFGLAMTDPTESSDSVEMSHARVATES